MIRVKVMEIIHRRRRLPYSNKEYQQVFHNPNLVSYVKNRKYQARKFNINQGVGMLVRYLIVLLFLLVAGGAVAKPDYHIFVDAKGRSLEAELLRYDETHHTVTVKPKGKNATTVPISVFSKEDQDFIAEWGQNQAFLDENKLIISFNRIKKQNSGAGEEYNSMSLKAYDQYFKIDLENKTDCDVKDMTVEYVVYYTQDLWSDDRRSKYTKDGTKYEKETLTLPSRSTQEIETATLTLKTYRESGYSNAWASLDSEMEGVIVTLSITTKSGKTISRQQHYPDNFDKPWTTENKDVFASND